MGMRLLSNLRVLATSEVGSVVEELREQIDKLETDLAEMRALSETRYRRLARRLSDEPEATNDPVGSGAKNPVVDRILARRAVRRVGPVAGG